MSFTIPDDISLCPDDFRFEVVANTDEFKKMYKQVTARVHGNLYEKVGAAVVNSRNTKTRISDGMSEALLELMTDENQLAKCLPKKQFRELWIGRAIWRHGDFLRSENRTIANEQNDASQSALNHSPSLSISGVRRGRTPGRKDNEQSKSEIIYDKDVDATTGLSMAKLFGITQSFLLSPIAEWKEKRSEEIKSELTLKDPDNRGTLENKLFIVENIEWVLDSSTSLEEIRSKLPHNIQDSRISQIRVPLRDELRAYLLLHQPMRVLCILEFPPCIEDSETRSEAGVFVSLTTGGEKYIPNDEGCVRIAKYIGKKMKCADSKGNQIDFLADTILFSIEHKQLPVGRPHGMKLEWHSRLGDVRSMKHDGSKAKRIDGELEKKPDWGIPLHITIPPGSPTEETDLVYEYHENQANTRERQSGKSIDLNLKVRL